MAQAVVLAACAAQALRAVDVGPAPRRIRTRSPSPLRSRGVGGVKSGCACGCGGQGGGAARGMVGRMAAGGRGWARGQAAGQGGGWADGVERRVAKGADAREAPRPTARQGARWTGGWLAAPSGRAARRRAGGRRTIAVPCPEQLCAHSLTLHDGPPQPGGQRQRPSPGRQSPRKLQSPGQARSSQPSPGVRRAMAGGVGALADASASTSSDLAHALLSQFSPPKPRWHSQTPSTHSPRPWQSSAHARTAQCSPPTPRRSRNGRAPTTRRGHSCCSCSHASPRQPGWQ